MVDGVQCTVWPRSTAENVFRRNPELEYGFITFCQHASPAASPAPTQSLATVAHEGEGDQAGTDSAQGGDAAAESRDDLELDDAADDVGATAPAADTTDGGVLPVITKWDPALSTTTRMKRQNVKPALINAQFNAIWALWVVRVCRLGHP